MFEARSVLSEIGDFKLGKILTASTLYRGMGVTTSEVETYTSKLSCKYSSSFVDWIPNRLMSSICSSLPPCGLPLSGTLLANCT